jgi:hypothetical protein
VTPDAIDTIVKLSIPLIGGVFSVLGVVITNEITTHMKDAKAASVLATAVQNALGAMEQAAIDAASGRTAPLIAVQRMRVGVRYVQEHAGPEAKRLGVPAEAIEDKIKAQQGLRALAVNEAVQVQRRTVQPMATSTAPNAPGQFPPHKPWTPHPTGAPTT